jgi:hypothetical protein
MAMPPVGGDVLDQYANVYRASGVGAQHAEVSIICQAASAP